MRVSKQRKYPQRVGSMLQLAPQGRKAIAHTLAAAVADPVHLAGADPSPFVASLSDSATELGMACVSLPEHEQII